MPGPTARREPVSIICVFNDPDIRRRCLDRSIEDYYGEATIEYLPIDNAEGSFASAGAALNYGASLASHDYLAFVHQDVYLHSLGALETAAGVLADDERIGLLGAIGITAGGCVVGRVRDRVLLLGEPLSEPREVDSLDELLFMIPRRLVQREPLSEAPELAWHGYAVEYGLRARALGLRVCASDLPLTHNSLTVNLDRLDVAYDACAARYPDALPLRTLGGTVTAPGGARRDTRLLGPHRWRYRWMRESVAAHAARLVAGGGPCVLGDIRLDVDEILAGEPTSPLLVVNLERESEFPDGRSGPLDLVRRGRPIMLTSRSISGLVDIVATSFPHTPVLLTNLRMSDLRSLSPKLPRQPRVLGFRREIGFWMLIGVEAAAVPLHWRSPKATPLGMPALESH
jgi:hypothetical protein